MSAETSGLPIVGAPAEPEPASATKAAWSAWFALGVLVVVSIFSAIDRQILTIAIEPVRETFRLSDLQIGLMQGLGLTLVGAFAGLPLAWLADRFDRRLILATCIVAWSVATAARGFAQDFNHLLVGTIGLAIAEAGVGPIVFSMIPSMFSGAQRAKANLIYFAAALVGAALGMGLAGLGFKAITASAGLLPHWLQGMEAWRVAFLAAALPGTVLAFVVMLIRAEHGRPLPRAAQIALMTGSVDERVHRSIEFIPYLRAHWRVLLLLFSAVGSASAAFAPITAWLAPAMARRFGMDPGDVGVSLGAVFGVGAIGGIALAGIAQRLWGHRYPGVLGVQVGQYLAVVGTLATGLLGVAQTPFMVYAATGIMMATSMAFLALLPGTWQELAPAPLRARMLAAASVVSVLATAGGPVLVGYLSEQMGDRPNGLVIAITWASAPCMLLGALLLRLSVRPVRRMLAMVRDDDAATAAMA